ncbi:flagellar biosynthetic protein FliO [Metabacillus sp. 84]|uniref:flagellar biosynthetic protein FliO n=1 Tax=unclassified Metabacillus TaxID=2675274 RepID=UPI003CEC465C
MVNKAVHWISILLITLTFMNTAFQSVPVQAAGSGGTVEDYLKQEQKENQEKSENPPAEPREASTPGVTVWDFLKMIAATLFVAGLIYLLFRLLQSKNKWIKPMGYLQNLGGTSLGQNRSIQIVRAGDEILLVGVGDSVQLLKVISEEEEIEKIVQQYEDKGPDLSGAKLFLSKAAQTVGNKQPDKNHSSFKDSLQKQLNELGAERKQKTEEWLKRGNRE